MLENEYEDNDKVAYLIVDEMHAEHPELVKDAFWDEGVPEELPYTLASEEFRAEPWQGSAAEVKRIITFLIIIVFLAPSVAQGVTISVHPSLR